MQFIGIREVHLRSRNLRKSMAFYQDLCSFPALSYIKDKHAIFEAGTALIYCHQMHSGEKGNVPHSGPHETDATAPFLTLECGTGEYDNNLEEFQYSEYKVLHEGVHEGGKRYFRAEDPDGHLIEMCESGHWEKFV
jgi:catechol 2,3-dioxygenase-like lactoylglutathione lyase family enzyme